MSQNESTKLPGFFFHPLNADGLVELEMKDRLLIVNNQGNYMALINMPRTEMERVDMQCFLDNNRIPTHRREDAVIPEFGHVPFDLREVIAE